MTNPNDEPMSLIDKAYKTGFKDGREAEKKTILAGLRDAYSHVEGRFIADVIQPSRTKKSKVKKVNYRCPACKEIIPREPWPGFLTPAGNYISYCTKNNDKRVIMRPIRTKKKGSGR
jgi:hypothetical protein